MEVENRRQWVGAAGRLLAGATLHLTAGCSRDHTWDQMTTKHTASNATVLGRCSRRGNGVASLPLSGLDCLRVFVSVPSPETQWAFSCSAFPVRWLLRQRVPSPSTSCCCRKGGPSGWARVAQRSLRQKQPAPLTQGSQSACGHFCCVNPGRRYPGRPGSRRAQACLLLLPNPGRGGGRQLSALHWIPWGLPSPTPTVRVFCAGTQKVM